LAFAVEGNADAGWRVRGFRCRVKGEGSRVHDLGLRDWDQVEDPRLAALGRGVGFTFQGLGFGIRGVGFGVRNLGFGVLSFGFRVSGLVFGV